MLARFRPDLIGLLATLGAVCFWLPILHLPNLVVAVLRGSVWAASLHCIRIVNACMYYMLVRLSGCLNHIKGTITVIIHCVFFFALYISLYSFITHVVVKLVRLTRVH